MVVLDVEGVLLLGERVDVLDVVVDVLNVVAADLDVVIDAFAVELVLNAADDVVEVVVLPGLVLLLPEVLNVVVMVEEPTGVRYQLAGASPRHSPAVTPFQPLVLIKSK